LEEVSGILFGVQQSISTKLVAAGATSREKAATVQEADLDFQERNWLTYIAGGLFAIVKKTNDERYYVTTKQPY
jgi:hypothetical protein